MNKLVSVLALVLLLQGAAFAQTASERRNARQKNEANAKDFDSKDPLFKPVQIPEKWMNRSAVVIAERVDFDYGGTTNGYFVGKIRRQIKLLDQAAVEEFGAFNFSEDENNRTGIQIIKADGKKVIIDMKAATPFKEELNSRKTRIWNTYVRGGRNQRKIAISGLEVGDIIDILTEIKTDYSPVLLPECSDIINIPFAEEYPIMKNTFNSPSAGVRPFLPFLPMVHLKLSWSPNPKVVLRPMWQKAKCLKTTRSTIGMPMVYKALQK